MDEKKFMAYQAERVLDKLDKELNAFKDDPEYIEELPGQLSFDDYLLDDVE